MKRLLIFLFIFVLCIISTSCTFQVVVPSESSDSSKPSSEQIVESSKESSSNDEIDFYAQIKYDENNRIWFIRLKGENEIKAYCEFDGTDPETEYIRTVAAAVALKTYGETDYEVTLVYNKKDIQGFWHYTNGEYPTDPTQYLMPVSFKQAMYWENNYQSEIVAETHPIMEALKNAEIS